MIEESYRAADRSPATRARKAMRRIIALACVFLSNPSLADTVRHPGVPKRVWGTWGPSVDLCRDDKSTVTVYGKSYVTGQENCEVRWVVETAGRSGPIYGPAGVQQSANVSAAAGATAAVDTATATTRTAAANPAEERRIGRLSWRACRPSVDVEPGFLLPALLST
jgi:hypothetical protein